MNVELFFFFFFFLQRHALGRGELSGCRRAAEAAVGAPGTSAGMNEGAIGENDWGTQPESDWEMMTDASPSPCPTPVGSPKPLAPHSPPSSLQMSPGPASETDEEILAQILPLHRYKSDE